MRDFCTSVAFYGSERDRVGGVCWRSLSQVQPVFCLLILISRFFFSFCFVNISGCGVRGRERKVEEGVLGDGEGDAE